MIVEICANSFESALAAQNAGADRIELCTQLSVGGLTPSHGLIEMVTSELSIPVHVLIRPRAGDFYYSKNEIDIMLRDIAFCKKAACAGVVSGVLNSKSEVALSETKKLVEATRDMQFTFHRAIDVARAPRQALREMVLLGINRVLSSGQQRDAIDGIELLKEFLAISEGKIEIMPGSGINTKNALAFKQAGFKMIHFSAITHVIPSLKNTTTPVSFSEGIEGVSDEATILKIIQMVNGK